MNIGKNPAFQFYPNDWLGDNQLQMASTITKGVWIQFLCRMWWANERGRIEGTREQLCVLAGCSEDELSRFLIDNELLNFACVTERSKIITIVNRRMEREEKSRKSNVARQARYRSTHGNAPITLSSPSPSPSPTPKQKKTHSVGSDEPTVFVSLWRVYPDPKGSKQEALKAFRIVHPPDNVIDLLMAQLTHKATCDKAGIFWPRFPHLCRWLSKRRWTDDVPTSSGNGKPAPVDLKVKWKDQESYLQALKQGRVPPGERVAEWDAEGT